MIGAARAEINPHPGLDPLIPGLTRDLLRKTRMRLRVKPAMRDSPLGRQSLGGGVSPRGGVNPRVEYNQTINPVGVTDFK